MYSLRFFSDVDAIAYQKLRFELGSQVVPLRVRLEQVLKVIFKDDGFDLLEKLRWADYNGRALITINVAGNICLFEILDHWRIIVHHCVKQYVRLMENAARKSSIDGIRIIFD